MSRAFLICPEPVTESTAGVGTRFLVLAKLLLEAGHRVSLAIPNDPVLAAGVARGVELVHAEPDRLGEQAAGHDWVLLHGHLGNHYLAQRDDLPVVVDLYDPFMIENFHYHRDLGWDPFRTDHATWRLQMGRGDFFLCSSEEQRFYYLGWLTALGRVHPLNVEEDPCLIRLICELPFGTPEGDPPAVSPRDQVLPGVGVDDPVYYFGNVYDWYDPEVILEALPRMLEADARTTVVFVDHPHPELTPLSAAAQVRRRTEAAGWCGRQVRFEGWRPFDRRFELPGVCDLAVVTHRPGLETDLSLRTRLVDLLWLGLPVVVTQGGTMSRVVREVGAGKVVPAGDPVALAEAVLGLMADPQWRREAAAAGRRWARARGWREVVRPLLEFADAPRRDPHRQHVRMVNVDELQAAEPIVQRILRRWRRLGRSS